MNKDVTDHAMGSDPAMGQVHAQPNSGETSKRLSLMGFKGQAIANHSLPSSRRRHFLSLCYRSVFPPSVPGMRIIILENQ